MQAESGVEPDGHNGRTPYRKRALSDKRGIAELCLKPGASVAGVALTHGANANLVCKWIAKYHTGEYGQTAVSLLPVSVRPDTVLKSVTKGNRETGEQNQRLGPLTFFSRLISGRL